MACNTDDEIKRMDIKAQDNLKDYYIYIYRYDNKTISQQHISIFKQEKKI